MQILRWIGIVFVVLLAAGSGTLYWMTRPPANLVVVTWGEDYQRAQMVAQFHPFTDQTGVDIDVQIYSGGLNEVRRQVESGEVTWDVVDFDLDDAAEACREGLLEPIDAAQLPAAPDGADAAADFVPGALGPCWVGSAVYSQLIAYAPNAFSEVPETAADFFDLARFPGMRALRDTGPEFNLPFALLADGVAPHEVYLLLESDDGIARAFAKLDTILDSVIWWRRPNEPIDWLASGEVTMAAALNGRIFDAQTTDADIMPLWDSQLYGLDVFGIPRGTESHDHALEFVGFATSAAPLAEQSRWVPYGPARRSAAPLVGTNPRTGLEMRTYLPTAPENFRNALLVDPDWWAVHGADLKARWAAWRQR